MIEMACRVIAFRGEDELVNKTILVEVTSVFKDGCVEIAFTSPTPGSPRIYLALPIPELMLRAITINAEDVL